jgi:hypothetical protein
MSEINDGGLAFPSEYYGEQGMTLRDVFAKAALEGICVNVGRNGFGFHEPNKIATECYSLADAMIKARKKKP